MIFMEELGQSLAAKQVQRVRNLQLQRENETVTLTHTDFSLDNDLIDLFQECRYENWDRQGAIPVEANTLATARLLILAKPADCPMPQFYGEPDGHVNVEWYVNPRRLLSVSIAPDGVLHWAALIGMENPRGSTPFNDHSFPDILRYCLQRIYSQC